MLRKNGIVLTTLLNFYEINLSKGHNLGYPQFPGLAKRSQTINV